jgi:hypothetical protein
MKMKMNEWLTPFAVLIHIYLYINIDHYMSSLTEMTSSIE